jgi:hypothetical protein
MAIIILNGFKGLKVWNRGDRGNTFVEKTFIDNEESGYKKTVNCANAVE